MAFTEKLLRVPYPIEVGGRRVKRYHVTADLAGIDPEIEKAAYAILTQLIERGAKVYAAARYPETVDVPGAVPLRLDVTKPESVAKAAQIATDVTC
jgi:hypothetical protein